MRADRPAGRPLVDVRQLTDLRHGQPGGTQARDHLNAPQRAATAQGRREEAGQNPMGHWGASPGSSCSGCRYNWLYIEEGPAVTRSLAAARDGEQMRLHTNGQDWIVSWHPGDAEPAGSPHGAAGVCVTGDGQLVLISHDGRHWGFPAGRPEGGESAEETLSREMLEGGVRRCRGCAGPGVCPQSVRQRMAAGAGPGAVLLAGRRRRQALGAPVRGPAPSYGRGGRGKKTRAGPR